MWYFRPKGENEILSAAQAVRSANFLIYYLFYLSHLSHSAAI